VEIEEAKADSEQQQRTVAPLLNEVKSQGENPQDHEQSTGDDNTGNGASQPENVDANPRGVSPTK